jgi:hypothetical protein
MEDLGTNGRIILKGILKTYGLPTSDSGYRPGADFCEHDNGPSGS